MADWTTISDTQVDPNAPLTSELMTALRDNPIAIAQGASGATRITDAALDTGAATTAGTTWVAVRNVAAGLGGIGSYAFLRHGSTGYTAGSTVAGSSLSYTNAGGSANGGIPSGTWRLMGYTLGDSSSTLSSVWQRIS